MLMEVIKKSREEGVLPALSATQGVKKVPSLVALGIASEQLNVLFQVLEREYHGFGSEREPRTTGMLRAQSSGDRKVQFTQKSIFEAAGEMSKLQTEANDTLEDKLKNEPAIMEAQLKAIESINKVAALLQSAL